MYAFRAEKANSKPPPSWHIWLSCLSCKAFTRSRNYSATRVAHIPFCLELESSRQRRRLFLCFACSGIVSDSSPRRSLVGAVLIAVSYVFMAYAAEVEVYGLAMAIAAGLVLTATADRLTWPRTLTVIFLGGLFVLTHAMLVLVTYLVVQAVPRLHGQIRRMYSYLAGVSAMLVLVTYGVFRLASSGPPSVAGYLAFLLDFPRRETALGLGWIIEAAGYFVLTFIGYNFLFAFPAFQRLAERLFGRFSLEEEVYLGDNTSQVLAVAGCLTALALGVILVIFFYKGLRQRPPRSRSIPAIAVVAWLVTTGAVQLWAGGAETWQLITAPFWVAAIWSTRQVPVVWPALLAASLGVHNLVGGLGPLYSPTADLFANKSAWIIAETDRIGRGRHCRQGCVFSLPAVLVPGRGCPSAVPDE